MFESIFQPLMTRFRSRRSSRADILFYAASWIDESWIRSTISVCHQRGVNVLLAVGGNVPPADSERYRKQGIRVRDGATPQVLRTIRAPLVVTASSGIPASFFSNAAVFRVHMPHSLVSLQAVYPADAFDGYNVLFAAGPQHLREYEAMARARNLVDTIAIPVGYGKADILPVSKSERNPEERLHVLLAPSWGADSLLPRLGAALVTELLARDFRVTLRPHPLQVIESDKAYLDIRDVFASHPAFSIELPSGPPISMREADLFVTDYSGTAFEYSQMRRRPAVFVDVSRKIVNPDWMKLGLDPVEVSLRTKIGVVVPPDAEACAEAISNIAQGDDDWTARIEAALPDFIYESASVGSVAADRLIELLARCSEISMQARAS